MLAQALEAPAEDGRGARRSARRRLSAAGPQAGRASRAAPPGVASAHVATLTDGMDDADIDPQDRRGRRRGAPARRGPRRHRRGPLGGGAGRPTKLGVTLDRLWDLLRQRRALRRAGRIPTGRRAGSPRPSSTTSSRPGALRSPRTPGPASGDLRCRGKARVPGVASRRGRPAARCADHGWAAWPGPVGPRRPGAHHGSRRRGRRRGVPGPRTARRAPPQAVVSLWVDTYDRAPALEEVLRGHARHSWPATRCSSRCAATTAATGGQSPGSGPTASAPRAAHGGHVRAAPGHGLRGLDRRLARQHSTVSEAVQPRCRYVRNTVFRAVTPGAPPYRGIVEEAWPSAEHVTDPMLFYCAEGDLERWTPTSSTACSRRSTPCWTSRP